MGGELNNDKLLELVEEIAKGTGAMQEAQNNQKDATQRLENRIDNLPTNETIDLKIANMKAELLKDIDEKLDLQYEYASNKIEKKINEMKEEDEKEDKNNETATTKKRDNWNVFKDWIMIAIGIAGLVMMIVAIAG